MSKLFPVALTLAGQAFVIACAMNDAAPAPLEASPAMDPVTVIAVDSATLAARAKADSAKPPRIEVPSVPGRNKRDSLALVSAIKAGMNDTRWPVKGPATLPGSILPAKRIVAYYGNPLSKKMGILGELPPDQMLARLDKEVAAWNKADPSTPVQPALHLIVVVAQGAPGRDGMYRLRMADTLIERVYSWAQSRNAILFLDIQVGKSNVMAEVPRLEQYLKRPNVHLGLDPEFSMKSGDPPGRKIGTMSSADVNWTVNYLSNLVKANNLPPKVLVVHRFTRKMLTDSKNICLDPRVQIVINMDGWGGPWLKFDSYRAYVQAEPVQYTGFKLFYHNDTKKGEPLLTPDELLRITPKPLYIQYQ
ncbi:MAG TPA: hypothetical protein VJL35_11455 [Gemmatimonadaceae bacterium]|nr:hypothetical protein [Gemmatimonadaceae bacterium]